MEMSKEQLIQVFNCGSLNYIKLTNSDFINLAQLLPEPGSEDFCELNETEKITVLRVNELLKLKTERK